MAALVPITAIQRTGSSTTSSSLVDPTNTCETAALTNGVDFLCLYCANFSNDGASDITEVVLDYGSTVFARDIAEGFASSAATTFAMQGAVILSGDGSSTVKFQFRDAATGGTAYIKDMSIVCIPLDDLTENTNYWYTAGANSDTASDTSVGSPGFAVGTAIETQAVSVTSGQKYLVIGSVEVTPGSSNGSRAGGAWLAVDASPLSHKAHIEAEDAVDWHSYCFADLYTADATESKDFQIFATGRQETDEDARRGRIFVLDVTAFAADEFAADTDSTGTNSNSTELLTISTARSANNFVMMLSSNAGADSSVNRGYRLRDTADATILEIITVENDPGFDANRDQMPQFMAVTDNDSGNGANAFTVGGSGAFGRNPADDGGVKSELVLWGLDLAAGGGNTNLDPATAEITLTGTAATLQNDQILVAATSELTLTGTAATLTRDVPLVAATSELTLTGTAAVLQFKQILIAATAAIVLTGTAATLQHDQILVADGGSLVLTGTAASLEQGYKVTASTSELTLTGTAASLEWDQILVAAGGSLVLTGTAASLEQGYKVTATTAELTLNGTAASLEWDQILAADPAPLTLTGTAASLEQGYKVTATTGQIVLTGTAVTFSIGTGGGDTNLDAEAGAITLTGTAAGLEWDQILVAAGGSVKLTGSAADLSQGYSVTATTGALTLTGTAAALEWDQVLAADGGSVELTGTAADLSQGYKVTATAGAVQVIGSAAELRKTSYGAIGDTSVTETALTAHTVTEQSITAHTVTEQAITAHTVTESLTAHTVTEQALTGHTVTENDLAGNF